jgi:hypothetical protein
MRKTLTTAALVFALSCQAWAGIMHTPPIAPEPEPTPTNTAQEAATTDEDTGATDTLTQIVLTVLVSTLP